MENAPLTLGQLATIITIVGAGAGVVWAVRAAFDALRRDLAGQMDRLRQESADGRKALYERIEAVGRDIASTYVRQDVYLADRRVHEHAVEELKAQLADAMRKFEEANESVRRAPRGCGMTRSAGLADEH